MSEHARAARGRRPGVLHAAFAGLLALVLLEGRVAAQDRADECLRDYEGGQRSRNAGALRQAKSSFAYCASDACPSALHADCARWLDEVDAAVPTSVFHVSTKDGVELQAVRIAIDGGPEHELDGRAVSFDPGEHVVLFTYDGYAALERRFTFSEGEKLIPRNVSLEPLALADTGAAKNPLAADAPLASTRRATLLPTWIAGGIGVVGMAGFAYFGSAARRDDHALDACSPDCSAASVERVQREYLLANVSLGIGAAGLLVGAAWAIFRPSVSTAGDRKQALVFELGPVSTLTRRF